MIEAQGGIIVGRHVTARTSDGIRYIDYLVLAPNGRLLAVEVKSGNAARSSTQIVRDHLMATEGALLTGPNVSQQFVNMHVVIPQ